MVGFNRFFRRFRHRIKVIAFLNVQCLRSNTYSIHIAIQNLRMAIYRDMVLANGTHPYCLYTPMVMSSDTCILSDKSLGGQA